jgi:hypothetical protein
LSNPAIIFIYIVVEPKRREGLKMKNLRLVFSIVVILTLVCSPVLAISKADLIASYKGQSSPTTSTPIPTPTNQNQGYGSISVISDPAGAKVYLDGSFKGFTPVTLTGLSPTCGYESRPGQICNFKDAFPHYIELTKIGYEKYTILNVIVKEGETTSFSVKLTPTQTPSSTPIPTPTSFADNIPSTCPENLPSCPSVKPYIRPSPTPTPLTPDLHPHIPASYPYIPESYYEWSKFPAPTPTPEWTYELPANLDYAKVFA